MSSYEKPEITSIADEEALKKIEGFKATCAIISDLVDPYLNTQVIKDEKVTQFISEVALPAKDFINGTVTTETLAAAKKIVDLEQEHIAQDLEKYYQDQARAHAYISDFDKVHPHLTDSVVQLADTKLTLSAAQQVRREFEADLEDGPLFVEPKLKALEERVVKATEYLEGIEI